MPQPLAERLLWLTAIEAVPQQLVQYCLALSQRRWQGQGGERAAGC